MGYLADSVKFDAHLLATPLCECNEGFVSLKQSNQKSQSHLVFSGGINKTFWLRRAVANALLQASQLLYQMGYVLFIEDAYRSLYIQKKKFLKELDRVQCAHPGINDLKAYQMTNTFIAGIPILAAHTAGAAVDVTLLKKSGSKVDLGCPYLTLSSKAVTMCHEISDEAKKNRKILFDAMETVGFSNYPFEYWHFSIGDVSDAFLKQLPYAIYGPIELDSKTGNAKTVLSPSELYQYFKMES